MAKWEAQIEELECTSSRVCVLSVTGLVQEEGCWAFMTWKLT